MLTIHVWPKRLKAFLLTHPLYKSPNFQPRMGKAWARQQDGRPLVQVIAR